MSSHPGRERRCTSGGRVERHDRFVDVSMSVSLSSTDQYRGQRAARVKGFIVISAQGRRKHFESEGHIEGFGMLQQKRGGKLSCRFLLRYFSHIHHHHKMVNTIPHF